MILLGNSAISIPFPPPSTLSSFLYNFAAPSLMVWVLVFLELLCHPPSVRQSDCQCFVTPCLELWVCLATIRWLNRLAEHASTHLVVSEGLCDCFNLEWVAPLMLSSTTKPPTYMFIEKRKNNSQH